MLLLRLGQREEEKSREVEIDTNLLERRKKKKLQFKRFTMNTFSSSLDFLSFLFPYIKYVNNVDQKALFVHLYQ